MVLSLKLWRDTHLCAARANDMLTVSNEALRHHLLVRVCIIESSLLHDDVEGRLFILSELP